MAEVVFRADGNTQLGLGHLYRSAALAAMLRPAYRCHLLTHAPVAGLSPSVGTAFASVVQLPEERELAFLGRWLGELRTDGRPAVVVLDGYHFTTDYQEAVGRLATATVAIDDIHATRYVTDLVINHSPALELAERYALAPGTVLAAGLAFSLLRPPFLAAAREPPPVSREPRFYLCFGGSDAKNVTTQLLEQLTDLGYTCPLDVVLGPANPHAAAVTAAAGRYAGEVSLHHNLDDRSMIALYRRASLAFLPASTTLIEALAVGVPVVAGHYVDNQVEIYHGLVAGGFVTGVGDWNAPTDLAAGIAAATAPDPPIRPRAVDGYSDVNLRLLFDQLLAGQELILSRPAAPGDARQYFEWVNDAAVRGSAIRTAPVAWEDHRRWFARKVVATDALLLIFATATGPCGQLRYDATGEAGTYLIDISLDRGHRGRGLARRILALGERQLMARRTTARRLEAFVRPDNRASARTFDGAGFRRTGETVRSGVVLLHFQKQLRP